MTALSATQALPNVLAMAAFVAAMSLVLSGVGKLILARVYPSLADDPTVAVTIGLALFVVPAWYLVQLGVPMVPVAQGMLAAGGLLAAGQILSVARSERARGVGWLDVLQGQGGWLLRLALVAALLTVIRMVAGRSGFNFVGTAGNNDLFMWALQADQLLGRVSFANIIPIEEAVRGSVHFNHHNGVGTSLLLAMCSLLAGTSALGATPHLTILMWSWLSIAVFESCQRLFRLSWRDSVLVGLLVVTNPLLIYLIYNAFYAQVLTTIVCLVAARIALQSLESAEMPAWRAGAVLIAPMSLFLLAYQSGFVFIAIAFGLVLAVAIAYHWPLRGDAVRRIAWRVVAPFLLGGAVAALLMPTMAVFLYRSIMYTAAVEAGWPLPLLNPALLMSVPVPVLFGREHRIQLDFYAALVCVLILLAWRGWHRLADGNPRLSRTIVATSAYFTAWIAVYLGAFLLIGPKYQVWKLATFSAYTMSWIPLSVAVLGLKGLRLPAFIGRRHGLAAVLKATAWMAAGLYFSWSIWQGMSQERMEPQDPKIARLNELKKELQSGDAVVIALDQYGDTMLAMNVMSGQHRVIPLNVSYFSAIPLDKASLDLPNTKVLGATDCRPKAQPSEGDWSGEPFDVSWRSWGLIAPPMLDTAGYRFAAPAGPCLLGGALKLAWGFSSSDQLGVWTDGPGAGLEFPIPSWWQGRALIVRMQVGAFLPPTIPSQIVHARVNGHPVGSWRVDRPMVLTLRIPAQATSAPALVLKMEFPNAASPRSTIPRSRDRRQLAVYLSWITITPTPD